MFDFKQKGGITVADSSSSRKASDSSLPLPDLPILVYAENGIPPGDYALVVDIRQDKFWEHKHGWQKCLTAVVE